MTEHVIYFTLTPTVLDGRRRDSYEPKPSQRRRFWRAVEQKFADQEIDQEFEVGSADILEVKHFLTNPGDEYYDVDFIAIKFRVSPSDSEEELKEKLRNIGIRIVDNGEHKINYSGPNKTIEIDLNPDQWTIINYPGLTPEGTDELPAMHYDNYVSLIAADAVGLRGRLPGRTAGRR